MVFEDAPPGIYSAKAAGCFTIAIPETWMLGDSAAEEAFAHADLRLKSLENLLQRAEWNEIFGSLPPLLVGFGNPTVDVISVLDDLEAHLHDFGLEPGTEATGLQDTEKLALVELARSRFARDPKVVPGGAAMNTLRVARFVEETHLRCAFIGAIGTDVEGRIIQEALMDAGVVPLLKQVEGHKTGVCGVLVDKKTRDRTLAMVRGAAAWLDPDWIERSDVSCLVNEVWPFTKLQVWFHLKVLQVEYFLEHNSATSMHLISFYNLISFSPWMKVWAFEVKVFGQFILQ